MASIDYSKIKIYIPKITASLLVIYGRKYKDFMEKYKNIINAEKFKPYFYAVFIMLLLYYLFLIMYEYYAVYQYFKPIKRDSVYILHLFMH